MIPFRAKILVVDDDRINRTLLTTMLKNEGYDVDSAENGLQCLDKLHAGSYDILLLDLHMPGLDGYEATRAIRKDPRFAKLPIIAMTANAMKGDRELCLEAGMNDYVSKPINRDELFSTIEKWSGPRRG